MPHRIAIVQGHALAAARRPRHPGAPGLGGPLGHRLPLWLGTAPALLRAFLEQCLRPGFAFDPTGHGTGRRRLRGKSARLVVTMGMPALLYRLLYRAHGVRSLQRGILRFAGTDPSPP